MLMTAAAHMDSGHCHLLYDFTAASSSSVPSSSPIMTPAPTAPPPQHHHHLRPAPPGSAARRVARRRPRPSRRLPTTYISADPASFRRMVHQVTGADDLPIPPSAAEALICRPAPSRSAAATGPGALLLPTLDTSAFLLGSATGVPALCHGSAGPAALVASAPALEVAACGGGVGEDYSNGNNGSSSCGGFPTLESWDPLF